MFAPNLSRKATVGLKFAPMNCPNDHQKPKLRILFAGLLLFLQLTACERPDPSATIAAPAINGLVPTPIVTPRDLSAIEVPTLVESESSEAEVVVTATAVLPTRPPATPLPTYDGIPTPDPPHTTGSEQAVLVHYVNPSETLGYIAQIYGSSLEELLTANQLTVNDFLVVGQEIRIPNQPSQIAPSFKIIPDSELVYGPAAKDFTVRDFSAYYNGFLMSYSEIVEGNSLAGPEIVSLVAHRYSVNPRLLLAVLEYQVGWVTRTAVNGAIATDYPMGVIEPRLKGLYTQLSWAADELNWGYYGRAEGGVTSFLIKDNTRVAFAADVNDGTAGVQKLFGAHDAASYQSWLHDVSAEGFFATYNYLFGNPFAYTVDPIWPQGLTQPPLQLPWPAGETWYFTGGPHGGWDTGSAWAALDFVPSSEQLGCVQSDDWVTAMVGGVVSRSGDGAVVVDVDGDGFAGTGWAITYMHLESRDRIEGGTLVQAGDKLGHPSCEGGFSNGTHVHIARSFNGRWISADGLIPFNMGGWLAQGLGREYDGLLVLDGTSKEACECRDEINAITREE
jgi:murein DD-endopeptidase MepM/ murein hydrolase activator NlpD